MVAVKQKFSYLEDGSIDIVSWLKKMTDQHQLQQTELITKALHLANNACIGLTTFYGQPCIEQCLEMAEIILTLKLDQEAAAASIMVSTINHANITIETIRAQLGDAIAKLVSGVIKMNVINSLANVKSRDQTQIDRLRKTLLAMVSDIRVVLIKLAERCCLMRGIRNINLTERKRLAQETMDLYAPLANRLGVGQLKWELEDFAFHYIDPTTYKTIANFLAERRVDREALIHEVIDRIRVELRKVGVEAELSGRAKHIYSIYLKQLRKDIDYEHIYDYSAVRILVPTLHDCYTALSIVHSLWEHIPAEFDDYISNPKPNGYRSIHTAVNGPNNKNMEIQIRTRAMHDEAEHGIAAHWIYKEDKPTESGYEAKITFLRQLLEWHKDVSKEESLAKMSEQIFEDRVYVFTPAGDILDLPIGATPLDFAYQVHSEIGHCCRGAKINGHIVPLTYTLKTGDQVDIITTKEGAPSRDWLNKDFGYLTTPRARAKVAQWFRHQEVTQYIEAGRHNLERELTRAGIHQPNIQKIAAQLNYKDDNSFFAAIGHGTLRLAHVVHAAQTEQHQPHPDVSPVFLAPSKKILPKPVGLHIMGADDLLTRIAKCCKPIPGDAIIGYITQGRGVSIHRKNCNNFSQRSTIQEGRFLDVAWDTAQGGSYYVDLQLSARGKEDLLKEITALLPHLKIDLINLNSTISKKNNTIHVKMTIQIHDQQQLTMLTSHLQRLPNIIDVKRIRE